MHLRHAEGDDLQGVREEALMANCRSCGAEIIWARTVAGRLIPLDAEPAERPKGIFRLEEALLDGGPQIAISAASDPVYISHFATCPHADEHRRERGTP